MQVPDAVADRLEHATHLPVAALVDRQLELRPPEPAHMGRRSRAVVELHAGGELGERRVARARVELGDVDLLDLVLRVCESMCELTVVRQQQHTRRLAVEPPDRNDARGVLDERRPRWAVPEDLVRS